MADPHVLTGLISKRREIAGQIEHTQDQLRQLVIDLDHVDAAIHIFDPSIELEEIKSRPVPPRHQAFKGEVTQPRYRVRRKFFRRRAHTARMLSERLAPVSYSPRYGIEKGKLKRSLRCPSKISSTQSAGAASPAFS